MIKGGGRTSGDRGSPDDGRGYDDCGGPTTATTVALKMVVVRQQGRIQ